MTRNEIIEALFVGKNFNDCIAKMEPARLREDLKMEVISIVCQWPDEKVINLHGEKKLEFYVVRVIINMLSNKYSPFFKKYRVTTIPLTDNEIADDNDHEERELRESTEERILGEINNLYWYNGELLRLYMKHGNYRAIEKETGIPFISCYKTIKKSFKELKQKAQL